MNTKAMRTIHRITGVPLQNCKIILERYQRGLRYKDLCRGTACKWSFSYDELHTELNRVLHSKPEETGRYLVVRVTIDNTVGGAPTVIHRTETSAKQEAERLAGLHPGNIFVVFKDILESSTTTVTTKRIGESNEF